MKKVKMMNMGKEQPIVNAVEEVDEELPGGILRPRQETWEQLPDPEGRIRLNKNYQEG